MKAPIASLLIIASSFFMSSCRSASVQVPKPTPNASTQTRLPEITSESEEGFHDLVFAIEDHKKLTDGSQRILASGMYEGKKVSLEIYLGAEWISAARDADVPITTFRGVVSYRSVGPESDLLLHAI